MDQSPSCSRCHSEVRSTDYYCFNCGNNLKPTPPGIDIVSQIILYSKSILLPPFGILWAMKYLKQSNNKSRVIGIAAIILTLISFIVTVKVFNDFMNNLNTQVNQQLNDVYGF